VTNAKCSSTSVIDIRN